LAVGDWSTTAADNVSVGAVNIAENCPSANLNNAIREVMAQVAQAFDDLGDNYQAKDALLTSLAGLTTAADQLVYATGPDTFALTALTAFARTFLDDADGAAVCNTIGAVRVSALSLANPGYIRFQVGASSYFQVAWGTFTSGANQYATVSYASAFPNAAFVVTDGGSGAGDGSPTENPAFVTSSGASSFTVWDPQNATSSHYYIAVGY